MSVAHCCCLLTPWWAGVGGWCTWKRADVFTCPNSSFCLDTLLGSHVYLHSCTHKLTNSPKPMSIELVMPSNHLILCRALLLPPIPPSIRVFSNESTLCMRWPNYWSFSFTISPNEHPGLIPFRMDWLDLLLLLLRPFCHHENRRSWRWETTWGRALSIPGDLAVAPDMRGSYFRAFSPRWAGLMQKS